MTTTHWLLCVGLLVGCAVVGCTAPASGSASTLSAVTPAVDAGALDTDGGAGGAGPSGCTPLAPTEQGKSLFVVTATPRLLNWTAFCNPTSIPVVVTGDPATPTTDGIILCTGYACRAGATRSCLYTGVDSPAYVRVVQAGDATVLISDTTWNAEDIYDRVLSCP